MHIHVGVCIPNMGSLLVETTSSLLQMATFFNQTRLPGKVKSQKLSFFFTQGSLLPQVREAAFRQAIDAGCTHILAVDSDMRFPRQVIHGMLAHDKGFIAGNYVTKKIPAEPVTTGFDHKRVYTDPDSTGLEEVSHVGLGLCLIETRLIKKIEGPLFEVRYFKEAGSYMGEDVYFCHKYREVGGKIFIDHDLSKLLVHIGRFEYTHDYYGALA